MANIQDLLNADIKHLTVSLGMRFFRPYGKRFDIVRIAMGRPYEQSEVEILRFIVARYGKASMPPHWMAAQTLRQMGRDGDPKTRDFLSVCHNNHQDYLLEVPVAPRNMEVAKRFLLWLDGEVAKRVAEQELKTGEKELNLNE